MIVVDVLGSILDVLRSSSTIRDSILSISPGGAETGGLCAVGRHQPGGGLFLRRVPDGGTGPQAGELCGAGMRRGGPGLPARGAERHGRGELPGVPGDGPGAGIA